jgi:hypothetical protein
VLPDSNSFYSKSILCISSKTSLYCPKVHHNLWVSFTRVSAPFGLEFASSVLAKQMAVVLSFGKVFSLGSQFFSLPNYGIGS